MLTYYRAKGVFPLDVEETMILMKRWYNKYRFAKKSSESIFNSNMVLYFIDQVFQEESIPDEMIDHNVQIDYSKLRHLILVGKSLNGNFDLLREVREVMKTGEVYSKVETSFLLESLGDPNHFYSLLFYFGLLTFDKEKGKDGLLCIPNQTVQNLMYSYIRGAFKEVNCFHINPWEFSQMIRKMAY